MTITVDASIVDGSNVTPTDPADAEYFDLLSATTAGPQIAPESEFPIFDPITLQTLPYLDGVVIGSESGSLGGTGTATVGIGSATQSIDLSREAQLVVFTFEQADGSQLVVRASITNGSGPTLQEFVNGYTLEDLLTNTDTLNGAAYTFDGGSGGGGTVVDPFAATSGPDSFVGTDGADEISGEGGNDTLRGGDGGDTINGGAGNDVVAGQNGDDSLDAGTGNDKVWAGAGNDTANAGDGNDTMGGGLGDDSLEAGAGADVAWAGGGNDTVNGGGGNDVVGGGAGSDSITTGAGNNTAWGGADNDNITAGNEADTIGGGAGNDTINAAGGGDVVYGGLGNDSIDGGNGNDTIGAGAGDDTITGGAGADVFLFAAPTNGETDTITDFEDGTDTIEIGGAVFADLTISDNGGNAEISVSGHTIIVEGVTAASLTEADFSFI